MFITLPTEQVGNEEGFWNSDAAANPYLSHVRDLYESAWGSGAAIVHTTDSSLSALLHGGKPARAYATVDFGPGQNIADAFALQRAANADVVGGPGPPFNSEYYIGGANANWGDGPYANDTAADRNASLTDLLTLVSVLSLALVQKAADRTIALESRYGCPRCDITMGKACLDVCIPP
jgi:hypothetical protein